MHIDQLLTLFRQYPSINTDTRKTQPGDLFFGLRGDRFDGNKFAAQALEKGAVRAIIDNPEYLQEGDERYILVKDSLKTLQNLARAWRRTFHIPFLGITGTNGKTTSKELIYSVLSTEKKPTLRRETLITTSVSLSHYWESHRIGRLRLSKWELISREILKNSPKSRNPLTV